MNTKRLTEPPRSGDYPRYDSTPPAPRHLKARKPTKTPQQDICRPQKGGNPVIS